MSRIRNECSVKLYVPRWLFASLAGQVGEMKKKGCLLAYVHTYVRTNGRTDERTYYVRAYVRTYVRT